MNEDLFKQLVQFYSNILTGLRKEIAPNFNVNQTIYKEFALLTMSPDWGASLASTKKSYIILF